MGIFCRAVGCVGNTDPGKGQYHLFPHQAYSAAAENEGVQKELRYGILQSSEPDAGIPLADPAEDDEVCPAQSAGNPLFSPGITDAF